MNAFIKLCALSALAASLAACDGTETTYIGDSQGHHLALHDGMLTLHVRGQPDAVINATGDLRIGGKAVDETAAQRGLLKTYYGEVVGIRTAGIETGKAGAKLAGHAIGEVVSGLVHGDTDHIDSRINDRAKDVEAKALAICENLQSLQETQDAIAASLPAFKPYAAIEVRGSSDCHDKAERHGH